MSEPEVETGIDWKWVRRTLDAQAWEHDRDSEQMERRTFLGTVFSLYPSGKYYVPWACSNLSPCSQCQGRGRIRTAPLRKLKKWAHAVTRARERWNKLMLAGRREGQKNRAWFRYYKTAQGSLDKFKKICAYCAGAGSREAYLDSLYSDKLNAEADERDLFVTSGEGDPCDIIVGETRERCADDDVEIEE